MSTLLGIIREIAAKCDTRHRLVVDIESRPESENGDSLSGLMLSRCLDSIYEKEKHALHPRNGCEIAVKRYTAQPHGNSL